MLNKLDFKPKDFNSIREMMDIAVADAGDREAYIFRGDDGNEVIKTFSRFNDDTEALGAALTDRGFGASHIACLGENSYDWITVFLTVLKSAGVFVPLDKELPTADKMHILTESESEVLFFSGKYRDWVIENMALLPDIKLFVCFADDEDSDEILSYTKLLESGREMSKEAYDALHSDENDLKMLVYTSGTTGIAKGVMLTEHNLVSCVYNGLCVSQIYDRGLSVLPYHHTYEAVCDILVSIHYHSTLCINRSLREIAKDMQYYKPSYIYLVPALAEFLYANIMKNIRSTGKEKKFNAALKISKTLLKAGIDVRRTLFKDIHNVFGGRMIKIVCGGAPIRPEMGQFFGDIGIYLVGGYGITECSPLVAVNHERKITYNTAGNKLPCIEWRIDDPNEEGIGEITVKGDTVMKGYYKMPEETAKVIHDGWFSTGDYGYITPEDQIVITGRKKNIIVLSNGKNIYPEEIENYIQELPFVSEVVVSGFKNEKGAEVGLQAEIYMSEGGAMSEAEILHEIEKVMKELPAYKHIKKVAVRSTPFEKTSSNKIKRKY